MIKTHFIIVVTKTEPVNVSSNPGRTHRVVSLAIMLSSSITSTTAVVEQLTPPICQGTQTLYVTVVVTIKNRPNVLKVLALTVIF